MRLGCPLVKLTTIKLTCSSSCQPFRIQKAHVEKILDSVLLALSNNDGKHERTFTYVETKFLYMWYEKLDETRRQALKDLVESKQFTFTNGGWCMHDEAPTHFSKCNAMTSRPVITNFIHL